MKTLYLIRHAKSSWSFDLPDHDRPLGKRGRKDVLKMGKFLNEKITKPDVLISSTASRAFYTALYLSDEMGLDEGRIRLTRDLFHAGPETILNVLHQAPNCETFAMIGHNPGFTTVANQLMNSELANIPTCGIVAISFAVSSWSEVQFSSGKQKFFLTPKTI